MVLNRLRAMAIFFCCLTAAFGKDKSAPFFPVALIDSSMKKDAWAVCRDFRDEFVLQNDGRAVEHVYMVITVLEKRGDDYAELEIPYDKTSKITSITGRSYDSEGFYDDRLKKNTVQDINYTSDGTLYDDLRVKIAEINTNSYPYTVEYEYDISYDGLLGYPKWRPVNGYHLSVERSGYKISYPDNMQIRYREFNLTIGCRTEKHDKGIRTLEWKIEGQTALKEEPFSPELSQETPCVITAPVKFDYCGTSGTMNSWADFGYWISQLIENRDQLSEERQHEIRELVKECKDTMQIVRTLYTYMQKRTHYVGIQLGIGGFQPFPAETVDRLGYGDCKALTNYMRALLKIAGIPSDYTVAGAAPSQGITMTDFPTASQCNHVILSVPLKKDTIWLECTSQRAPCGYLSRSTAGRNVLIVDPGGSRIVTTPLLTAEQSCQKRTAEVTVSPTGAMDAKIQTDFTGYQYDNVSEILMEPKKIQEKALYDRFPLNGMSIADFSYLENKSKIPHALESITLSSPMTTTRSGSRIFIPMNIFNRVNSIPSRVENRRMPVFREFAYLDIDSVTFNLPKGFKIENLPPGKTLTTPFGEYRSTLTVKDNQAFYTRRIKMNRGKWSSEQFDSMVDFYTSVVNADKIKLVIREE